MLYNFQINHFGGSDQKKVLAGVDCDGHEKHLSHCFHKQIANVICTHSTDVAGVTCSSSE